MNELNCLEHPTLKVPYEVFNKRYRSAQRVLDVEARQVASVTGEIDTTTKNQTVTTGEIDSLLGGMVEKLTTMKRKASEAINEELQAAYVCKKRLEHLKEQASALNEPSTPQVRTAMNQWRKVRLDRMLVDYFLRNGYYKTANKLADARSLRDLTNAAFTIGSRFTPTPIPYTKCQRREIKERIHSPSFELQIEFANILGPNIYAAAAEVESELCQQRTARCLQWCADNKSKLRKLNSNMEFKIRIQEFIELVRDDKRLEAVRYAKKHFSTYEEGQLEDIQHCMGMLAFPKDTEVEPYRSLLGGDRWAGLVEQFRWEHARLLHPARLPALPIALQLGLAALNTPYPLHYIINLQIRPSAQKEARSYMCTGHVKSLTIVYNQCYKESTKVSACPVCQPPLNTLSRSLPHAHCSHSRLVCRITNEPLNEHNQPMVLPNGQVYGEKAIKEMVKLGSIVCPKTKEVFSLKSVEKVYVM
ncbi:unnamed protein product [Diatraea saccharalis]|uniref:E3 ubiquitin-protein transferase MAEA n=1 Tax=Diatraea saccharalis TaxID=40085 RepID=A0A9N9RE50_9NEOP|nr:unnamed protein product [Diatraea saccharalis]